jgi:hypothetical protein
VQYSFDVVLPKALMPPAYTATVLNAPGRTRVRLRACRLVNALSAFIVAAASEHAKMAVFIEQSSSSEDARSCRINAIDYWKEWATSLVTEIGLN